MALFFLSQKAIGLLAKRFKELLHEESISKVNQL